MDVNQTGYLPYLRSTVFANPFAYGSFHTAFERSFDGHHGTMLIHHALLPTCYSFGMYFILGSSTTAYRYANEFSLSLTSI